jgi:hypothetical protein
MLKLDKEGLFDRIQRLDRDASLMFEDEDSDFLYSYNEYVRKFMP